MNYYKINFHRKKILIFNNMDHSWVSEIILNYFLQMKIVVSDRRFKNEHFN